MSEVLVLVASGGMSNPSGWGGGWSGVIYCRVAQSVKNLQWEQETPPQNVICLLLGWIILANKAEPIPCPAPTHTQTPLFSFLKYCG